MTVLRHDQSVQPAVQAETTENAMEPENQLTFGPFRLDVTQGHLCRGTQVLGLRRRSLAMLRYLVEHPGRLVTKAELRQHVWAGTHVTDTVLRVCVQEIRAALGDAADAPHYLATVGRQGYRFLVGEDRNVSPPLMSRPIVGRQGEVDSLASWFQHAAQGARQLVFVSGQGGVGKTTVVERWLARLAAGRGVRIVWGQCVEHYGEGEPYLPLLEALGQLSRGPDHQDVVAALRRYAPMWLVQLPGLLPETELERLQRQVQGATSARMLRELAEALDVLTAETPLVLVLEDLHWSDRSTVEALTYVAQRRAPARLLVLGTYRPVETAIQRHPLRHIVQELCGRGQAVELRLELLPAEDVEAYVTVRLGGPVSARLAAFVYERTEGNALFLVNILEHLVSQGLVVRREGEWTLPDGAEAKVIGLPEGLRQLLVRRLEDLPPEERRMLEAASVAGERFTVAAVAAGVQCPVEDVEASCEALAAQHQFIEDIGLREWPDGTSSGRYRFTHALYRQVLYEGLGTARRGQLHRRIGVRLEVGYGAQACELAAQLAVHFERGGELPRAVHYWEQAGDNAMRRNAHHEAIAALRKALALLATLPESRERTQRELTLQLSLAELLRATKGVGSPDVGDVYTRAYTLCQQVGETPQLPLVLWGLSQFHVTQGQVATADELVQQLLDLVQRQPDTEFVLEGHFVMGTMASDRGEFLAARAHLEHSCRLSDTLPSPTATLRGGFVRGVTPRTSLARVLWALGYADQAQQRGQEALLLARQGEHLPSLAYAECFVAHVCQCLRDVAATQAHADALMALAAAQSWPLRAEQGRILRGWALAMQGEAAAGVAHLRQGLASPDVEPTLLRPHWLALLAEAYGRAGQPKAGLQVLAEAVTLMATTEMRWSEAEMFRLRGELLLQLASPDVPQAEACFQQAIDVARCQQAKSLELRAALSLSRLLQRQGKREAARELLAPIYSWFTEGFDTPDLQEAEALLEELT
jgi:DNA-binding winged helix-turn-helix (wHTH) protein/predicted ATPase